MADLDTKYVLVPREPTREMMEAGEFAWCERPAQTLPGRAGSCYRAMIAAAPALPKPSDEVAGMVKFLHDLARNDEQRAGFVTGDSLNLRDAAALLEALDAKVRTAWNEAIEAAAKACIDYAKDEYETRRNGNSRNAGLASESTGAEGAAYTLARIIRALRSPGEGVTGRDQHPHKSSREIERG